MSPAATRRPLRASSSAALMSAPSSRSRISSSRYLARRDPRPCAPLRRRCARPPDRQSARGLCRPLLSYLKNPAIVFCPSRFISYEPFEHVRAAPRFVAARLLHRQTDVETGEIAHRERSHRKTEALHHRVDARRRDALFGERRRLAQVIEDHPVADEAERVAGEDGLLAQRLAELERRRDRLRRSCLSANDLEQRHDVRRHEEMQAEHAIRPFRLVGQRVDVERRGIAGENRVRLGDGVELSEDLALDVEVLEDRLDDDVGVAELVPVVGKANRLPALPGLFLRQAGPSAPDT